MSTPYKLKIQLTVLDELGVNLYSNTPAVLSELVANSWDADAMLVHITFDMENGVVTIEDDGCGMTGHDLQEKFLNIGYRKRKSSNGSVDKSLIFDRPYMGRKGIGKLSMFSIANTAKVSSVVIRDRQEVFRGGIALKFSDIQANAEKEEEYEPTIINDVNVDGLENGGTRIVLSDLKVDIGRVAGYLRTRLARRFSVIGGETSFEVKIGDSEVTAEDRNYFHKLQEVWWTGGSVKSKYERYCCNLGLDHRGEEDKNASYGAVSLPVEVDGNVIGHLQGWIGAVKTTSQMTDNGQNLNKLILLVRGKLAHENLLPLIGDDRIWRQYLIGEITADFLDHTEQADIALASRQGLKEGDERFSALIDTLTAHVKSVISEIASLRKAKEEKTLLDLPTVKEWMAQLSERSQPFAKKVLSKVVKDGTSTPEEQKIIIKHTIIAFEYLDHQDKLHEIETADVAEIQKIAEAFSDINLLEATMYGEIASGRIKVIKKLRELVEIEALEVEFQNLIAKNLWLLDTSWERAIADGNVTVERSIRTAWAEGVEKDDVENGRIDITYKSVSERDVIIELKRSNRPVNSQEIQLQCRKYIRAYKTAMRKLHGESTGYSVPNPDTVVLLGNLPTDWSDADEMKDMQKSFQTQGIRIRTYENLLELATQNYQEYLEKEKRTNKLRALIDSLDEPDEAAVPEAVTYEVFDDINNSCL